MMEACKKANIQLNSANASERGGSRRFASVDHEAGDIGVHSPCVETKRADFYPPAHTVLGGGNDFLFYIALEPIRLAGDESGRDQKHDQSAGKDGHVPNHLHRPAHGNASCLYSILEFSRACF